MNKSVNVDSLLNLEVIKLSHRQNAFTFMFSTLKYKDAYVVYYMLDGIDKSLEANRQNECGVLQFSAPGQLCS